MIGNKMKTVRTLFNCASRNYLRSTVERRLHLRQCTNSTGRKNIASENSAFTNFNRVFSQSTDSGKADFEEDSLENIFGEFDELPEEEFSYPKELNYNGRQEFGIHLEDIQFDVDELENFDSNFYTPSVEHSEALQNKIDEFYEVNDIKTTGENVPHPMFTFEETGFPEYVSKQLARQFDKPTPIQSLSWPVALSGRDLVGIAQTGSGKTLSFLAPAIKHIMGQKMDFSKRRSPTVVILCPTRELAMQCYEMASTVSPPSVKCACVYGGSHKQRQVEVLSQGCNLLVATPGRLMDLIDSRHVDISGCSYAVLDEADRMLDMGFEPQIRSIFGQIRPDRQITMWSATWPHEIRSLANQYLTSKHGMVMAKIGGDFLTVNRDVEQKFHFSHSRDHFECFVTILKNAKKTENSKVLVFCNTKRNCDMLVSNLRYRHSITSTTLHGGLTQRQREKSIRLFKFGHVRLLISTEVAARGLDVDNITHVINYDCAMDCTSHIHRVGRTGRAGKSGVAHTIVTEKAQVSMLDEVIKSLKDVKLEVDPKLLEATNLLRKNKGGRRFSSHRDFNREQSFSNIVNQNMNDDQLDSNRQRGGNIKVTMDIESSQAGIIIGKGGSKIKELQDETSTKIWVPKNDGFDCVVVIVGSQENINYAKHLITDLLAKTNHQGVNRSKLTPKKNNDFFAEINDDDEFDDFGQESRFVH